MKKRLEDILSNHAEMLEYVIALHGYLWAFVRAASPEVVGDLSDVVDTALEVAQNKAQVPNCSFRGEGEMNDITRRKLKEILESLTEVMEWIKEEPKPRVISNCGHCGRELQDCSDRELRCIPCWSTYVKSENIMATLIAINGVAQGCIAQREMKG